ncbi:type II toxin-antitoxin system RelE/ParE family toxin [Rhizobium skierniewicense]|uniref:type II toxin-antitoxin system RelE/ParE family toxin n=1 Tax=Rhizobium skierniewicense TaxID=984260 RepID=UPI0015729935|nr:type II toxin-antitoxin system RelE/ParE family toxin [Rhizobium skierniewicense]NTF31235.1 type II toxin-antitoxin system RelE/ParE family toxin [Rhizobium skierniewicense]
MVYEILRSKDVERDLELIFDHLVESYLGFREEFVEAFKRADARLKLIENDIEALGHTPYQGTLMPHILPALRSVTKHHAVFYFKVFEDTRQIRLLAVFFGAQDHQRHMLRRLLGHGQNEKGDPRITL